jgi:hypothetical protein
MVLLVMPRPPGWRPAQRSARRDGLGLSHADCCSLSGLDEIYVSAALSGDAPSGRQAGWQHVQYLVDVLFEGGFRLTIKGVLEVEEVRAQVERRLVKRGYVLNPLRTNGDRAERWWPNIAESARRRGVAGKVPIADYSRLAGEKGGGARASPTRHQPSAKPARGGLRGPGGGRHVRGTH